MSSNEDSPIRESVAQASLFETPTLSRKAPGKLLQSAVERKRGELKDLATALDVKDVQIALFESDISNNDKKLNALYKKIS